MYACYAGFCAQPSPLDGVKNGNETDVDCGGTDAPRCRMEKNCRIGTDCLSMSCRSGKHVLLQRDCVSALHCYSGTCMHKPFTAFRKSTMMAFTAQSNAFTGRPTIVLVHEAA